MLTFTEEILLLLGDEDGVFLPVEKHAFDCALAGAVLMDLAFAYRIDTDLEALFVIDPTPTGNPMLDGILAKIAARTDTADTGTWIGLLSSDEAAPIRDKALASLVERGILERREERFLWAFRSVRYPTLDRSVEDGIKSRIEVVLSDEIPDPRDVALISLVDACEILQELFPDGEIERVAPRIQLLRKMDLVGREVAGKIADIQRTIIRAARARAARFQKFLLTFSAVGGVAAAATLLAPRIGLPDRYGPGLLELLWFDGVWQQWTGYSLSGRCRCTGSPAASGRYPHAMAQSNMLHRMSWRPRFQSWCWHRVAAPAAACRRGHCGEPRSTGRAIGSQKMTVAVPGGKWNHLLISRSRERQRAACDDLPSSREWMTRVRLSLEWSQLRWRQVLVDRSAAANDTRGFAFCRRPIRCPDR